MLESLCMVRASADWPLLFRAHFLESGNRFLESGNRFFGVGQSLWGCFLAALLLSPFLNLAAN